MPQSLLLEDFGEHIRRAFGHVAYHVGSSMGHEKREFRDVDVRLILPDKVYAAMELGDPEHPQHNKRWCSLVRAWSAFGKALTGLPIDFQIQQQTLANVKEDKPRSALFRICECMSNQDIEDLAFARWLREHDSAVNDQLHKVFEDSQGLGDA